MFLVFSFYVFEIILVELEYSLFWGKINLFKFEENWRKKIILFYVCMVLWMFVVVLILIMLGVLNKGNFWIWKILKFWYFNINEVNNRESKGEVLN